MVSQAFLGWTVIILSVVVGIGAMVFIMAWLRSHRLRVRDPLNKGSYIIDCWMYDWKDKATGILYWVSSPILPDIKLPEPPKDAIDVGKRGRKYAEAYKLSEDEFVWINDKGIKIEEKDGVMVAYDVMPDGTAQKIDSFTPFTSTQRQVLINQHIKADEISKKRWTPAEIAGMVSVASLVFVVALMLIFGGDFLKDYKSARANYDGLMDKAIELSRMQALMIQALGINIEGMDVKIAYTPQTQGGTGSPTSNSTPS